MSTLPPLRRLKLTSWSSCTSDCYSEYREVRFFVDAFDALTGSRAAGAQYFIYSNFPPQYENCEDSNACGTEEGAGEVGNTDVIPTVPAESEYLVTVKLSGYYTWYFTSYVGLLGAARSDVNLVESLVAYQDKVILSWDHNGDLDLSVLAFPAEGSADLINWQNTQVSLG